MNTHQTNLYVNMALVHSKLRNLPQAEKAIEEAQARMPMNSAITDLAEEIAKLSKPSATDMSRKARRLRGSIIEN